MDLANINMQTLIHVGVELVVIGGLVFLSNKRIGAVETSVEELNKKIAALEIIVDRQQQILAQQDAIFRQIIGDTSPGPRYNPNSQHRPPLPQHSLLPQQQSPLLPQQPGGGYPPRGANEKPLQKVPIPPPVEQISPDALDEIIEQELGKMAAKKSSPENTQELEIETTVPKDERKNIKRQRAELVAAPKKKLK